MATKLALHGMNPGQETGHMSKKARNQQSDSIKSSALLTVLQEAITLSTEQGSAPKNDRFSDVLVSLKQFQKPLQSQTAAPIKQKSVPVIKTPVDQKGQIKQTDTSRLLKSDKLKQETSRPIKSHESKESSLPEITTIPTGKTTAAPVANGRREEMQSSPNQSSGKKIAAPAPLYSSQIMEEIRDDVIGLNLLQQSIIPLNGHPIAQEQKHQGREIHQDLLNDQLTQWMNEGKVQIQKTNTPLEMNKAIVVNTEEFNSQLNGETKNPVLSLGDSKQQAPQLFHTTQNSVSQQTSPQNGVPLETAPQKTAAQGKTTQNTTLQETATQLGAPAQENTQNPKPTAKPQKAAPKTDVPQQDFSRTAAPGSAPQPITRDADKGGQRAIDPKVTDKSPLQKVNTLEEGGAGKTLHGENRATQMLSEKVGGKIDTSLKSMTMAEKVQALQQVKSQMKAAMQKGETHMLVKLTPDDLGKVDIKVDISRDGTVSAFFKADNRETMILLSKYSEDLRQIFGESGLNADASGMNFSSSDQQSSLFDKAAKSIGKNIPMGGENEAIIPPSGMINNIYTGLSGDRRLNITV